MYDELYSFWKKKKKKKEKILALSFINNFLLDVYYGFKLDIIRFDIKEFANLYGYKDSKRININDFLPLIINRPISNEEEKLSNLIAVDVPLSDCISNTNYSLDKVVTFYKNSNADLLVIDIDNLFLELIKRLSKLKIPVIIYSKKKNDDQNYIQDLHNRLLDSESMGALLIMLEGFSNSFVQNLRNSLYIPVITYENSIKSDGYYSEFSNAFGLSSSDNNKYLNLYDLIKTGINDFVEKNKK